MKIHSPCWWGSHWLHTGSASWQSPHFPSWLPSWGLSPESPGISLDNQFLVQEYSLLLHSHQILLEEAYESKWQSTIYLIQQPGSKCLDIPASSRQTIQCKSGRLLTTSSVRSGASYQEPWTSNLWSCSSYTEFWAMYILCYLAGTVSSQFGAQNYSGMHGLPFLAGLG